MSLLRFLVLLIAAGAALLAALMVRGMSSTPAEPVATVSEEADLPEVQTKKILIAASDLSLGARVTPEDFAWQDWPEDAINSSFFNSEDAPDALTELSGSVVRSDIFQGEPITGRKLVQTGDAGFMAAVLTPGMRAAAVEISVETAAGGFILPNDRVDLILTRNIEVVNGELITEKPVSETVLQNIRVLAIDQTFGTVDDGETILPSTATLELEPHQAEVLALAQNMGDIALSLRSVSDSLLDPSVAERSRQLGQTQSLSGTVKVYRSSQQTDAIVGGAQ